MEVTEKRDGAGMKLRPARLQVSQTRFLFGTRVNDYGFLTDGGRVVAISEGMDIKNA